MNWMVSDKGGTRAHRDDTNASCDKSVHRCLRKIQSNVGQWSPVEFQCWIVVCCSGEGVRSDGPVVHVAIIMVAEEVVLGDNILHAGAMKFRDEPEPHRELVSPEVILHAGFHA